MVKLNWTKIKNEYINGEISYAKLAEKHKVSLQAIKDRGTREKWVAQKKEQQTLIQLKTNQKTAEKLSEQNAEFIANLNNAANELLEKIQTAIKQTDLYIEKTKKRLPKKAIDKTTGETVIAWYEEEDIRLTPKDGINIDSVVKLTNAIKTMQSIQLATQEGATQEAPTINITVKAATPKDVESEEE